MMSDAVRDVSSKWGHVLINIITFRLAENMPACETQRMTPVKINELRNESQTQGLFFSISSSLRCLGPLSLSLMGGCSNTQDGKDFCPSVQFGSFVRGSTQILEHERGRWGPVGYLHGREGEVGKQGFNKLFNRVNASVVQKDWNYKIHISSSSFFLLLKLFILTK